MHKKAVFTSLIFLLFIVSLEAQQTEVYFNEKCEAALKVKIHRAKKEIRIAIFSFTRYSIAFALEKVHKRGVDVQVIVDKNQADGPYGQKVLKILKKARIPVSFVEGKDKSSMHHKFAVIDESTVLTGSYNYTTSASTRHDENLLILDDKKIAMQYLKEWQRLKKMSKED